MSFDYLMLIGLTLIIGLISTAWVNHALKKNSSIPISSRITGAEAAEKMLHYYGIYDVDIHRGGSGDDYFDPKSNSITLSPDAYGVTSITALATACHEVGHACQYAKGYQPMKVRSAIFPVVNFASNSWMIILIIGICLNLLGLVDLAIIMYAFVVLFQLVTLPVEFDASHRALEYMETICLPADEVTKSKSVLRACAFTYVAAALTSILQLLWLLGQRDN